MKDQLFKTKPVVFEMTFGQSLEGAWIGDPRPPFYGNSQDKAFLQRNRF